MMDWEQPDAVLDRVAQLGEPTAQFAVGKRRLVRHLVLGVVLILVGAGIIAFSLFVGLAHIHSWHIVLLGPLAFVAGVRMIVRAYRNLGLRVVVFPEGVVRVRGDDVQAFFWEDIARVWQKKNSMTWAYALHGALVFQVQRTDGTEIVFDDSLPGLNQLGGILLRETLPHLLPRALEAYDEGHALDFGKLRVSARGWGQSADSVSWQNVKSITLTETEITIVKKNKWGAWLHATVSDFPNFHVFRAVVQQRTPIKLTEK